MQPLIEKQAVARQANLTSPAASHRHARIGRFRYQIRDCIPTRASSKGARAFSARARPCAVAGHGDSLLQPGAQRGIAPWGWRPVDDRRDPAQAITKSSACANPLSRIWAATGGNFIWRWDGHATSATARGDSGRDREAKMVSSIPVWATANKLRHTYCNSRSFVCEGVDSQRYR